METAHWTWRGSKSATPTGLEAEVAIPVAREREDIGSVSLKLESGWFSMFATTIQNYTGGPSQ